jgi:hypothetical protein
VCIAGLQTHSEVFDDSYAAEFLRENKIPLLNGRPPKVTVRTIPDRERKTADVTIQFE